jgi:hypothetical protein
MNRAERRDRIRTAYHEAGHAVIAHVSGFGPYRATIVPGTRVDGSYKGEVRLKMYGSEFKQLAAQCASIVKGKYQDMADCHNASLALVDVLRSKGYRNATVIGCSVMSGSSEGLSFRCGGFEITEEAAHSVVLASGFLIDPTAGQFRNDRVVIPDSLVIPPETTSSMLRSNRQWLETRGACQLMSTSETARPVIDYSIAYIPTDFVRLN